MQFNQTIMLLSFYQNELKTYVYTKTYAQMFIKDLV